MRWKRSLVTMCVMEEDVSRLVVRFKVEMMRRVEPHTENLKQAASFSWSVH